MLPRDRGYMVGETVGPHQRWEGRLRPHRPPLLPGLGTTLPGPVRTEDEARPVGELSRKHWAPSATGGRSGLSLHVEG